MTRGLLSYKVILELIFELIFELILELIQVIVVDYLQLRIFIKKIFKTKRLLFLNGKTSLLWWVIIDLEWYLWCVHTLCNEYMGRRTKTYFKICLCVFKHRYDLKISHLRWLNILLHDVKHCRFAKESLESLKTME